MAKDAPTTSVPQGDRQDRRRRAIVETARKAFMRHGYGATTMSAIAAELGGSKTTLWSYFRNKQDLFVAVLDAMVTRYGEALRMEPPVDGDPPEVLTMIGNSIMRTVTSPQIVALHRMVMAEAGRSQQIGRLLWERGPMRGQAMLGGWLQAQMERGTVRVADPLEAARHFIALCQAGSFHRHLMGAMPKPTIEALEAEVAVAVQTFLRAYGLNGGA
ncbi:TetR/AcrR family transcriptional regulator [Novosphingobium cyanobacteriorum]|uniref:TetR/AcrR family transcriptional regulator n=1 Tax=Novosphingobium cyanobacteriorum TaxID=3024215 RepID=A0ABT6CF30_9SPHN|nr:TetR/AcrR family transcriptional regulator [Novosphingobium cyanobacteriorum]MDF8331938.1 TetR/AcrR family transcriptional regulator [Novosphingobium cyanobacteriorum]